MFAIIAAVLFGVGLLLDLIDVADDYGWLLWAGLCALALHFALGVGIPWRRQP
jgi:Na+/proline symporter